MGGASTLVYAGFFKRIKDVRYDSGNGLYRDKKDSHQEGGHVVNEESGLLGRCAVIIWSIIRAIGYRYVKDYPSESDYQEKKVPLEYEDLNTRRSTRNQQIRFSRRRLAHRGVIEGALSLLHSEI